MSPRLFLASVLTALVAQAGHAADPTPAPHKLKVVLVGDSTVAEKSGWGTAFGKHLLPDAECVNIARGGRSSKSFIDEGWWQKALAQKPDWVLIQFGHNDQPGKGPERETDPNTTYRANMLRYVGEARAAGAKPVLITSMTRRNFKDGHIVSDLTPYVEAVKRLAEEQKVPLVDLHADSIAAVEKMTPEEVAAMEPPTKEGKPDHTHLNDHGGDVMAAIVVADLRKVAPELAAHFTPDSKP